MGAYSPQHSGLNLGCEYLLCDGALRTDFMLQKDFSVWPLIDKVICPHLSEVMCPGDNFGDYMWRMVLAHSEHQPQLQVPQRSQERPPGGKNDLAQKVDNLVEEQLLPPFISQDLDIMSPIKEASDWWCWLFWVILNLGWFNFKVFSCEMLLRQSYPWTDEVMVVKKSSTLIPEIPSCEWVPGSSLGTFLGACFTVQLGVYLPHHHSSPLQR